MYKRNNGLRVSSIDTFWPGGILKSKTKYDRNENVAYTINYDEQGSPLNGVCGDFMAWQMLDAHTIKITGDGDMDHFSARVLPPWHAHEITSVIIEEGVRSIGLGAFSNIFTKACIQTVSFPESLLYVPDDAFIGSPMENEILLRYMR